MPAPTDVVATAGDNQATVTWTDGTFSDDFNRTDGVRGSYWAGEGRFGDLHEITGNILTSSDDFSGSIWDAPTDTDAQFIEADAVCGDSSGDTFGLFLNLASTADFDTAGVPSNTEAPADSYLMRTYAWLGGTTYLLRGSSVVVTQGGSGVANHTTQTLRMEHDGSGEVVGYVNGSEEWTYSDGTPCTGKYVGLMNKATNPVCGFDNFSAGDMPISYTANSEGWYSSADPWTITGVSWEAGDVIVVVAGSENGSDLPTTVTNANLTFTQQQLDYNTTSVDDHSPVVVSTAIATSTETGQTISQARTGSGKGGCAAYVIRPVGTGGIGVSAATDVTNSDFDNPSLTVSEGSTVVCMLADWNATTVDKAAATGSGTATVRDNDGDGDYWGYWIAEWQGTSAGTYSFGPANQTGLLPTIVAVEITDTGPTYTIERAGGGGGGGGGGGLDISDDFNRADEDLTASANWVDGLQHSSEGGSLALESNRVNGGQTNGFSDGAVWATACDTDAQYAEGLIYSSVPDGGYTDMALCVNALTSEFTAYCGDFINDDGTHKIELLKVVDGDWGTVLADDTHDAVGETLRIEHDGSGGLTIYSDDVEKIDYTDGSPLTGGTVGLTSWKNGFGAATHLDDFAGGDLGGGDPDPYPSPTVVGRVFAEANTTPTSVGFDLSSLDSGTISADDIAIVHFHHDLSDDTDLVQIAGDTFTRLDYQQTTDGRSRSAALFWRRLSGTEGTVTFQGVSDPNAYQSLGCIVVRGVDTTTAFDATEQYGQNENSVTAANAAITTTTNNTLILLTRSISHNTITAEGAPSGYDLLALGGSPYLYRNILMATKTLATAGTETPGVWTTTASDGTAESMGWTLALRPAVPFSPVPNQLFSDDFNRADEWLGADNANWNQWALVGDLAIVSNKVPSDKDPTYWDCVVINTTLLDADSYVEADIDIVTSDSENSAWLFLRCPADDLPNGYFTAAPRYGGTRQIGKYTGGTAGGLGTATTLATETDGTPTGSRSIRLEAIGTTLTTYLDGVEEITYTGDTTFTSGGYSGMLLFDNDGGGNMVLDNFSAGDLTTSIAQGVETYTDITPVNGNEYTYRVKAGDSAWIETATIGNGPTGPPTDVVATAGYSEATVTWTDEPIQLNATPSYTIERALGGSFSDDFNRADGAIGANWINNVGNPAYAPNNGYDIVSNRVQGQRTDGAMGAYWATETTTNAQYAQIEWYDADSPWYWVLGINGDGTSDINSEGIGYALTKNEWFGDVWIKENGTTRATANGFPTSGDMGMARIEHDGAGNVTGSFDGVEAVSYTGGAALSGKYVYIGGQGGEYDNFSGGDYFFPVSNQLVADDFNRADGALGSDWQTLSSVGSVCEIVSNTAQQPSTDSGDHYHRWQADTLGTDHFAQADLDVSAGGTQASVCVRMQPSGTATTDANMWLGILDNSDGARIAECNDDSWTDRASDTGVSYSSARTVRLEAEGSTMTLLVDGVEEIQYAGATAHSDHTRAGFHSYSHTEIAVIDNFSAGDLTTSIAQGVETYTDYSVVNDTEYTYRIRSED